MNARKLIGAALLLFAACGAVHARTIQYDCGQYDSPSLNATDPSVTVDNVAVAFSTGAPGGNSCFGYDGINTYMYQNGSGFSVPMNAIISSQVFVVQESTNQFEIEYLYDSSDAGCASQNATLSLSVGGKATSYSATGVCNSTGNDTFIVTNGVVSLPTVGSGQQQIWSANGTTASAPELDANSAFAGLTLLLGGALVARGRRVSRPQ